MATDGTCRIRFRGADREIRQELDRIAHVYARGGEDFLKLASGAEVRLDRVESVDGHATPGEPG